jgi:hypothetical protein
LNVLMGMMYCVNFAQTRAEEGRKLLRLESEQINTDAAACLLICLKQILESSGEQTETNATVTRARAVFDKYKNAIQSAIHLQAERPKYTPFGPLKYSVSF